MTRSESMELIRTLERLVTGDAVLPLRDASRCGRDLRRALEIITALEGVPGPPGLVREKLTSTRFAVHRLFVERHHLETASFCILHDLASLKLIVMRGEAAA